MRRRKPVLKAAEANVRQFGREMKEVARTYEADMKAIADSLPQPGPGESPTAGIRILEPGERLSDPEVRRRRYRMPGAEPITPVTRRMMRFIKWKMAQLARADAKAGRCPSEKTMLNRSKWVMETAFIIELGKAQRLRERSSVR